MTSAAVRARVLQSATVLTVRRVSGGRLARACRTVPTDTTDSLWTNSDSVRCTHAVPSSLLSSVLYLLHLRKRKFQNYRSFVTRIACTLISCYCSLLLLLRYAIQKKYKNQTGMNLTTPPPSQNSHAVRWHCTTESERRVAEIKS